MKSLFFTSKSPVARMSQKLSKAVLVSAFLTVALSQGALASWQGQVVAGSGPGFPSVGSFSGDQNKARSARLHAPAAVSVEKDGGVLIVDAWNRRVRRVKNGVISTVAGNGRGGDCLDRGRALSLCLAVPHGVLSDQKGGMWIADTFNAKIRKVDKHGRATTVFGGRCNNISWVCKQNGPANKVKLSLPIAVKPSPQGLLITDAGTHRVLLLHNNRVSVIAGDGNPGFSGDGGAAKLARLHSPQDAVFYQGQVLIADGGNCRLRLINKKGIIKTIAGEGTSIKSCQEHIDSWLPGPPVEDGEALTSKITVTSGITVDGLDIYLSDFLGGLVRKISNGRIETIAGVGGSNRLDPLIHPGQVLPDKIAANQAALVYPSGLEFYNNKIIVADPGNSRIWSFSR